MDVQKFFADAFAEFEAIDYNGMHEKGTFFSYFMHPIVPFASVALYWFLSKPFFAGLRDSLKLDPKHPVLQWIVILHSAFLAVYSGWTCFNAVMIMHTYVNEVGFYAALCDVDKTLWFKYNMGFWITHFYISKYYEFIDTWIVLLKSRTPSFLQTYHHAGIVILMWGFVVTLNSCVVVIVCLNSFIHTLMYTYYTFAAFGVKSPLKSYLTQAQIIQFIVGICITSYCHVKKGCLTPAQSLVLGTTQLYAVGLIFLFVMFYIQSYSTAKKDSGKKKK